MLYLCDRLVAEEKIKTRDIELNSPELGDFKLLRVSHKGCEPILPYPAQGYTELLLEATWDKDFRLNRPSVLESSSRNAGLPYDPEAAFDSLKTVVQEHPKFIQVLQDNPTPHGPHDSSSTFTLATSLLTRTPKNSVNSSSRGLKKCSKTGGRTARRSASASGYAMSLTNAMRKAILR
jgi:hypothetical protein